jgi:tetratricopeptide (TPR) repeat protein
VAINKANTPVWMKAVLILMAIVFVFGFISIGASPFLDNGQQPGTAPAGSLDAINGQFTPTVSALTTQLQSEPESYTVLVNLGNTYFDWAVQVQQQSQTTSAAVGADLPLWVSAKDAYGRALAVKPGEPPVTVDYAITLFYTGESTRAIEEAEAVAKADPEFAPAFFNLGIFYGAVGENATAITNLERYLELDPEGKQGNADFAKNQLQTLRTTSTPATLTP